MAISALMNNGFSFQDASSVLQTKRSAAVYAKIRMRLAEGEQLHHVFADVCPKEYRRRYSSFAPYLPFLESLQMTVTVSGQQDQMKKMLVSGTVYPFCLLVMTMAGIAAFSRFVLPSMIALMSSFEMEGSSLLFLQKCSYTVSLMFFLVLLASALTAGICLMPGNIEESYRFVCRYFPGSIPVRLASAEFSRYFSACQSSGLSTLETLHMLRHLKDSPLTVLIASELDRLFLQGKSMVEASETPYVEPALTRFMKIAVYSSDCEGMMKAYLNMVHQRTETKIRNFSKAAQLISYSCVGILIVIVYRIMMLPMTMISQL